MALHPSDLLLLFTSGHFADDVISLSIGLCSLCIPRYALPFILPSVISHIKTSFLDTSHPDVFYLCQILAVVVLSPFAFSRTACFGYSICQ